MESTNLVQEARSPLEKEPRCAFNQDFVLTKNVNFFGREIKRGSIFKPVSGDWYVLWENNDGIIMHCPAIKIHFTSIRDDYFVKMYQ